MVFQLGQAGRERSVVSADGRVMIMRISVAYNSSD